MQYNITKDEYRYIKDGQVITVARSSVKLSDEEYIKLLNEYRQYCKELRQVKDLILEYLLSHPDIPVEVLPGCDHFKDEYFESLLKKLHSKPARYDDFHRYLDPNEESQIYDEYMKDAKVMIGRYCKKCFKKK